MKTALMFIAFLTSFTFSQDTISTILTPDNNGAIIQNIVRYSPTAAYQGLLINAKSGTVQIIVTPEIRSYVWQDTTKHNTINFFSNIIIIPDSIWSLKEQAWICSLTVHGKYRMRQNITLDTLCKH